MGNNTSHYDTISERYRRLTQYVTHPLLKQRLEGIDEAELEDGFAIDPDSIPTHWIRILQDNSLIDWSDIPTTVRQCISDISKNKASYGYVQALFAHIVDTAMKDVISVTEGLVAILNLANGVADHPQCWVQNGINLRQGPDQLHRIAAAAMNELDEKYRSTTLTIYAMQLHDLLYDLTEGHQLFYKAVHIYKDVVIFARSRFCDGRSGMINDY